MTITQKVKRMVIGAFVGAYIGSAGGNFLVHYTNATRAEDEAKKEWYGENLAHQWTEYAKNEWKEMKSPKVLIPYSALWDANPKPLKVNVIDNTGGKTKVQFDIN